MDLLSKWKVTAFGILLLLNIEAFKLNFHQALSKLMENHPKPQNTHSFSDHASAVKKRNKNYWIDCHGELVDLCPNGDTKDNGLVSFQFRKMWAIYVVEGLYSGGSWHCT